jgi:hypothetical protein
MTMLQKGFVVWLLLMGVESLHGMVRIVLLEPGLGDVRARQVAVLTGSLLILTLAFFCVHWIGATTKRQLLEVGGLWLLLTIAFEIGLGRFVMHLSWERIAADYNLFAGGLMPLGLIVLALAPLLATLLRHRVALHRMAEQG